MKSYFGMTIFLTYVIIALILTFTLVSPSQFFYFYLEIGSKPGWNSTDVDIGVGLSTPELKDFLVLFQKLFKLNFFAKSCDIPMGDTGEDIPASESKTTKLVNYA